MQKIWDEKRIIKNLLCSEGYKSYCSEIGVSCCFSQELYDLICKGFSFGLNHMWDWMPLHALQVDQKRWVADEIWKVVRSKINVPASIESESNNSTNMNQKQEDMRVWATCHSTSHKLERTLDRVVLQTK